MDPHYHRGLLFFIHLLISADGVIDENELEALRIIKEREKIPETLLNDFEEQVKKMKEREIYEAGMGHISHCNDRDKLKIFVWLYKLSEVDGRVHIKEIRLLLYSIKIAGVDFEDVVNYARTLPPLR
jgi:uncharacterized tellurite resistance protein B-like protein